MKLTTRRAHDPVVADLHYVPVASSIRLEAGQTSAQIRVVPLDDTLVNGLRSQTFQIVPNPAYRIASRTGATRMIFHDDDCPHVGISVDNNSRTRDDVQSFRVTANPAPRRDTEVEYVVGGSATGGVDYEALPGTVTIRAGKTSAAITIKPYRRTTQASDNVPKTVVLTLPVRRFTFFDFYDYLTDGQPRVAKVSLTPSEASPTAPQKSPDSQSANPAVEQLRREVSQLGWIVFSARSGVASSDLDLFAMRPDGSSLRNLTHTPGFDEFSARVSPVGKRLLYRRLEHTPRKWIADVTHQDVGNKALKTRLPMGTLVIANVDGTGLNPVGNKGDYSWATWGPSGKQIACLEAAASDAGPKPAYRIVIRDVDSLAIVRELPSGGIHSNVVWSPDGRYLCGTADIRPGKERYGKGIEYPLGIGNTVSLDTETGRRNSVARFPDWYPSWATDSDCDWFQGGSSQVLHSANNYGICPAYHTMLWRSGLEQTSSKMVFAEYGKNVWGGCTSPDDQYAIFVIAGNSWPLQGKMAIIRLSDAPIARGSSTLFHEVLADLFPTVKRGPVLDLLDAPEGFDPQWTSADFTESPETGRGE